MGDEDMHFGGRLDQISRIFVFIGNGVVKWDNE